MKIDSSLANTKRLMIYEEIMKATVDLVQKISLKVADMVLPEQESNQKPINPDEYANKRQFIKRPVKKKV